MRFWLPIFFFFCSGSCFILSNFIRPPFFAPLSVDSWECLFFESFVRSGCVVIVLKWCSMTRFLENEWCQCYKIKIRFISCQFQFIFSSSVQETMELTACYHRIHFQSKILRNKSYLFYQERFLLWIFSQFWRSCIKSKR